LSVNAGRVDLPALYKRHDCSSASCAAGHVPGAMRSEARANAYCSIYNFQHFFKILSTALNKAALSEQAGLFDAASVY
jgi:hypothetical protein